MGAKGQRQGWQRHSVDEYREYMDDEQHMITAEIDPELLYPDMDELFYHNYFEYWDVDVEKSQKDI